METIFSLDKQLHKGPLAPTYLLIGDHEGMQRLLTERLVRAVRQHRPGDPPVPVGRHDAQSSDAEALLADINGGSLFATVRIVVVTQCHLWKGPQWQRLADYVANPHPEVTLILQADKVDQRMSGAKVVLGHVTGVDSRAPFPNQMTQWIRLWGDQHGLSIGQDIAGSLVEACGPDITVLEQALQKLAIHAFGGQQRMVTPALVQQVVTAHANDDIFALTDAIGLRHTGAALGGLSALLTEGHPPVWINFMVTRHWRMLTRVRSLATHHAHLDPQMVATALKIPPRIAPRYIEQAAKYREPALRAGFARLFRTDHSLKSSRTSPRLQLTQCLMALMAG